MYNETSIKKTVTKEKTKKEMDELQYDLAKKNIRLHPETYTFIPNLAIARNRTVAKNIRYFDEKRTYHITTADKAFGEIDGCYNSKMANFYSTMNTLSFFIGCNEDQELFLKAINRLKENDTWDDLLRICRTISYECKRPEEPFLERFIGRIEKPAFIRTPENPNRKTFDFVKILMSLCNITPNAKHTVEENFAEIQKIALEKIAENKAYQKFGVPVEYLRLTNAVITKQLMLELTYELKELTSESADSESSCHS